MLWTRCALLGSLPLLAALSGCSEPAPAQEAQEQYGPMDEVPSAYLGTWHLSHQVCDEDTGEKPQTGLPTVIFSFQPDHTYEMNVEGWSARGTYRVDRFVDDTRLQIEGSLYNFRLVGGTLENWSEGDAVYQCGNVFVRDAND